MYDSIKYCSNINVFLIQDIKTGRKNSKKPPANSKTKINTKNQAFSGVVSVRQDPEGPGETLAGRGIQTSGGGDPEGPGETLASRGIQTSGGGTLRVLEKPLPAAGYSPPERGP